MNRRKAIGRLLMIGGAGLMAGGGFTWFRYYRKPDLASLDALRPMIDELAETIIPETDTPGAKSAGAGEMIIRLIRECAPRNAQNRFLTGLADVEDYARSRFGQPYLSCNDQQKDAITAHFEVRDRSGKGLRDKAMNKLIGPAFFQTLKKYTVISYCTSMQGATKGLQYDYLPGIYRGIIPLSAGQKCWATS